KPSCRRSASSPRWSTSLTSDWTGSAYRKVDRPETGPGLGPVSFERLRCGQRLGGAGCRGVVIVRGGRGSARPGQPVARTLDVDVVNRRDVERQQLRHEQAADDGEAERAARFRTR